MNTNDSAARKDEAQPIGVAIVGMECRLPQAGNLRDFWQLVCFGSTEPAPHVLLSPAEHLSAVIAAALADKATAKEQQRQAALRMRRQAPNARRMSNQVQQARAPAAQRLLIAVTGSAKAPDLTNLTGVPPMRTLQHHDNALQALATVSAALQRNECDLGVVAGVSNAHELPATAALVLQRAAEAHGDDERIYASLRGVAFDAEAQPLQQLYAQQQLDPARISMLECVTALDGSAELGNLNALFGSSDYPGVLLGASHASLRAAGEVAGLASVMKMALALYHRTFPPTPANASFAAQPLPARSRMYVRSKLSPWIGPLEVLRLGAVHQEHAHARPAHVILEEPPAQERLVPPILTTRPCELIVLSAATHETLLQTVVSLSAALEANPNVELADLAYTLAQRHATSDRFRLATVVNNVDELRRKLSAALQRLRTDPSQNWADFGGVHYGSRPAPGKLAFLFPGVGFPGLSGSYADRVGELAMHFPELRWWLDCAESICKDDGVPYPLRFQLYPPDNFDPATLAKIEEELKWSQRAAIGTQIANLATCQLMRSFGVMADAMAGFSLGEWSALVAAGFIDSQGIKEWQDSFNAGMGNTSSAPLPEHQGTWAMATASADQVEAIIRPLGDAVGVTLDVSASQVFIGGDREGMAAALALLNDAGIWAMPLPSDGPMAAFSQFHTKHAAAFAENMRASLKGLPLRPLDCPIYSSVNARVFPLEPEAIVPLIVENSSKAVRLRDTIGVMYRDGFRTFVQLGGGGKLLPTVEKILGLEPHVAMSIDVEYLTGLQQIQHVLARLMVMGRAVQPLGLFRNRNCRTLELNLPAVPRQRAMLPAVPRPAQPIFAAQKPRAAANDNAVAAAPVIEPTRAAAIASALEMASAPVVATPPPTVEWPLVGEIQQLVSGKELDSILTLDLSIHRFLVDHTLILLPEGLKPPSERLPTLPFTFGVEIICEVAQTLVPELRVIGCRDVEQVKFVALKSTDKMPLWIRARRSTPTEVTVEFGMVGDSRSVLRGTVEMAQQVPALPPPFEVRDEPAPHDADWYYGKGPFFHGPLYRALKHVDGYSPHTIRGRLIVAEARDFFYGDAPRTTVLEAVLLDAVAQMIGYRGWMERQRFFVPTAVKRLRFRPNPPPPNTLVEARIRWHELDARRVEADLAVIDEHGDPVMLMEGWREWWMIWPKCFLQANHMARTTQLASDWATTTPVHAYRMNQASFLDADADHIARLYLTANEWRQHQQQRRVDWLLSRIAAKDAVRAWYRTQRNRPLHPLEVELDVTANGTMVVTVPGAEPLLLSIAWTDDEAIAVAASEHDVGVDLAVIKPRETAFLDVLLSEPEMSLLPQSPPLEWVHRAWAAKEAFCKMVGDDNRALDRVKIRGLHEASGSIEVSAADDSISCEVLTLRDKSVVLALAWRERVAPQPPLPAGREQPQTESTGAELTAPGFAGEVESPVVLSLPAAVSAEADSAAQPDALAVKTFPLLESANEESTAAPAVPMVVPVSAVVELVAQSQPQAASADLQPPDAAAAVHGGALRGGRVS